MFFAELAVLFHFNSIGSILFVFVCPVVTIFTFRTGKRNVSAHLSASLKIKPLLMGIDFKNWWRQKDLNF